MLGSDGNANFGYNYYNAHYVGIFIDCLGVGEGIANALYGSLNCIIHLVIPLV